MQNTCYELSKTHQFADYLSEGLKQELLLTPKPGLVDRFDTGSHSDLTFEMMSRSIQFLHFYYKRCTVILEHDGNIHDLRDLGIVTEQIMYRQFNTNTHRGAVFLGGLILAAVHFAPDSDSHSISKAVTELATELFNQKLPIGTKGALVRERFEVGGIVAESLDGLPAIFQVGIPALEKGARLGLSKENGCMLAMAELMCVVEDTTTLKRGGYSGLKRIQKDGKLLKTLLLNGENPQRFLTHCNAEYQKERLTMGGVADLLGMSIACYLSRNGFDRQSSVA